MNKLLLLVLLIIGFSSCDDHKLDENEFNKVFKEQVEGTWTIEKYRVPFHYNEQSDHTLKIKVYDKAIDGGINGVITMYKGDKHVYDFKIGSLSAYSNKVDSWGIHEPENIEDYWEDTVYRGLHNIKYLVIKEGKLTISDNRDMKIGDENTFVILSNRDNK
jgi:hypothetical protein